MTAASASGARDCREAVDELRTIADLVRWAASRFGAAGLYYGHGTDNAVDEALELTLATLDLEPGIPAEFFQAALTRAERERVVALVGRRVDERVPLPYLTGRAWFAGLRFDVDEHVLIPRSPLAELIERAFEPWVEPDRVARVLDLCTGSGCIAVACALAFPDAIVDASDISEDALAVARRNVAQHGLDDRVRLLRSDLLDGVADRYDLIVSNPPYVDREEMARLAPEFRHEPTLALASGSDGLDCVRRILGDAREHLADAGLLVVEVGVSRPALEHAFEALEFEWIEFERGGEGVFALRAEQLP